LSGDDSQCEGFAVVLEQPAAKQSLLIGQVALILVESTDSRDAQDFTRLTVSGSQGQVEIGLN
jgi:hypothetical protein